jgi:excisionase family DNA binding protein
MAERKIEQDEEHSSAFYTKYLNLMKRFKIAVEKMVLFEQLEDWWYYTWQIDEFGASLLLEHISDVDFADPDDEEESTCFMDDQEFVLLRLDTRLLTIEEYAEVYGVGVGTVRQWIRRGKLRSAVKYGREWRIPELAEVTKGGYAYGYYKWSSSLTDLPEEYGFMNEYTSVTIFQNQDNKSVYTVSFTGRDKEKKVLCMDTKEKEKFELMLISNPMIKAHARTVGAFM